MRTAIIMAMKDARFTSKVDFAIDGVTVEKAKRHWREVLSCDILRKCRLSDAALDPLLPSSPPLLCVARHSPFVPGS